MAENGAPAGGAGFIQGRALARSILEACEQEQLAVGARIPTERRLAEQFGVSRTAVRNALALLEADGRVSREVGRGTFLLPGLDARPDVGPADVMAARRAIEPQVLPLVVAWANESDFAELDRCLAGGARAASGEEFESWDFALHHAIVVAGHNPLLLRMYGQIEEARRDRLWGNLKARNDTAERRAAYQAEHVEIVDALRARELDRAVAAMRAHLERVNANLGFASPQG